MRPVANGLLVIGLVMIVAGAAADDEKPAHAPRSGLVEKTGRRLAQLDVTVSGPDERVADLTRDDFDLVVGATRIDDFIVDRLCETAEGGAEHVVEDIRSEGQAPVELPPAPAPTFLFYFDQTHLTMRGWNEGMRIAETLVPELIRDGARGMVVSSGEDIVTYAKLSDDPGSLLAGLQRLRDERHWDPFAEGEDGRVRDVIEAFADGYQQGSMMARRYQQEERWRTGRALRRFAMVLGRLADLDPPKAVLYFADTMRSNAGQHYVDLLSSGSRLDTNVRAMETDSFTALNAFDRVLNEAAAHGIRLYTIQAQGLTTLSNAAHGSGGNRGTASGTARISSAENSLKSMAAETGGQAFTGGYSVKRIVRTIRDDLSCLYLVSFDPAGLPLDGPLDVTLRVTRPGVKARVRGRIVIQSESARLTSTLLAAFGAPETVADGGGIHGALVPTGFADGRFQALIQVQVPGAPVSGAAWDVGASMVADDRVFDEISRRIEVSGPGVPVVLETEASFRPGPYSVVSVAHESRTDLTVSGETKGSWPDPSEAAATITGLTIVQPDAAVFVRAGEVRKHGSRAVPEDAPVRTERPTAFVGLVCWDKGRKSRLTVERTLAGDSSAGFPPMQLDPGKERCAYFRDLVSAGTMTAGGFTYRVRVLDGEKELASAERRFLAEASTAAASGTR